jgi:hypothetical protein
MDKVPITVHNENGRSPFPIVANQADNSIPRAFGLLSVQQPNASATSPGTSASPLAICSPDCRAMID